METPPLRARILETVVRKSSLKQQVFDNTFAAFNLLKEVLFEMASEFDDALDGKLDRRVRIEYRDRGKFETQLQVASDILIFQMHTDVFDFDGQHPVRRTPYVAADAQNAYCGMVNIYNFLSDSFKFNRNADEGYLIGRLFINRERRYFVEGKGLISVRAADFGTAEMTVARWSPSWRNPSPTRSISTSSRRPTRPSPASRSTSSTPRWTIRSS